MANLYAQVVNRRPSKASTLSRTATTASSAACRARSSRSAGDRWPSEARRLSTSNSAAPQQQSVQPRDRVLALVSVAAQAFQPARRVLVGCRRAGGRSVPRLLDPDEAGCRSPARLLHIHGSQYARRQLRRAATLEQLEQRVQIPPRIRSEGIGQVLSEPRPEQVLAAPLHVSALA